MQGMMYRAVQVAFHATTLESSAALTHVSNYINKQEKQKKEREHGIAAGQACTGHLRSTEGGGNFLVLGNMQGHALPTREAGSLIAVQ